MVIEQEKMQLSQGMTIEAAIKFKNPLLTSKDELKIFMNYYNIFNQFVVPKSGEYVIIPVSEDYQFNKNGL
jgi:hypothetical protein